MPPRLGLVLPAANSPRLDLSLSQEDHSPLRNDLGASLNVSEDGTLKVFSRSNQEFKFNANGFVRSTPRSSPAPADQPFRIAEKDVHILKVLGRGASSVVQKAFYPKGDIFVAVKKINVFEKEKRHQMMNDVRALCEAPNEPGLVQFIGAYHAPEAGQIAIVLEYMDAGSLGDVLQKVGKIPEDVLSRITAKVLRGLNYLHRNKHTVHRDIKPANILVSLDGEPKITDFGISAFVDNTLAVCNTFLGTVTYMSPERINSDNYSFPADIWSLGLTLVECAMGRYPYDASVGPLQLMIQVVEEAAPIPAGFSPEFTDFVTACLAKDPLQRPCAEDLLHHPFITRWAAERVDVKGFLRCVYDPHDRLTELAIIYTSKYYGGLAGGRDSLAALAPLYTDESILTHEGATSRGRARIMAALRGVVDMYAAFGSAEHRVTHLDCQQMDTGLLVHIMGTIAMHGASGLGGRAESVFTETFGLAQSRVGEYYIANQAFRLLK